MNKTVKKAVFVDDSGSDQSINAKASIKRRNTNLP